MMTIFSAIQQLPCTSGRSYEFLTKISFLAICIKLKPNMHMLNMQAGSCRPLEYEPCQTLINNDGT